MSLQEVFEEELEQAHHRINLLIDVIERACKAAGIIVDWAELDGPQVLMLGEDLVKLLNEKSE